VADIDLEGLERAAAREPASAEAHKALGNARKAAGDLDGAMAAYRRALEIVPDYLPALYNIGLVLRQMNRMTDAERHFARVHALYPGDAEVLFHLAALHSSRGAYDEAVRMYLEARKLDPGNANLLLGLAHTYWLKGALDRSLECCEAAARLQPDNLNVCGSLQTALQRVCDWSRYGDLVGRLRLGVVQQPEPDLSPFVLLSIPSTRAEQLACARKYAAAVQREAGRPPGFRFERGSRQRLRIGYLSGDFREHAIAMLSAELFELHDRSRFEVFGYSLGPDDRSARRARIARAFDRFTDVSGTSSIAAASAIHADRIDILVDLHGYTELARLDALALRPAPIQVTYLGYPGTTGADFIDYAVVDRVVAPPEEAGDFSEQLIHMPACYQVNDRRRPLPQTRPRRELGLPESAFVFCCFNASYKLAPEIFSVWMRLLHAVPDSVLWLLEGNPWAVDNLRREARARGVEPERILFAPQIAQEPHLARISAADLFLDCLPYNAHTTASDALWTGLPVLTCAGDTFASRVGSSLLLAVGLPELVTRTLPDYEALALRLAREPGTLGALRERLRANRATAPLFDTPAFTRSLETAYQRIWETYASGGAPRAVRL
jgi:predicted O-linked N-acetylglucosamine transferase (SPINDLY family)